MQRLIEDEELRDNLKDAFEVGEGAYGRATGNGKSTVKAVTCDKKVQKDLRQAAENLQEPRAAAEAEEAQEAAASAA